MSSIRNYWITELKETVEFQELANTQDVDFDILEGHIKDLMNDQFIETATESGIARREVILGIMPAPTDTLEQRRTAVQFKWNNALPYTYRKLEQQLNSVAGGEYVMVLDHDSYSLTITINLESKEVENAVRDVAKEMVPANIVLTVELKYNDYALLSVFTYGELSVYTYEELRSKVLN